LSSFIIAILFFLFLFTNVDNSFMSEAGWCYYVIACLSHSFIMAVIPYLLLFLPITLLTKREVLAAGIYCGVLSIMMCLFLLDYDVYGLYRFHINGFVIGMALGTGASEIFDFGTALYVKAAVVVLLIILFNIALLRLSGIIATHISGKKVLISYISVLLLMTLGVNM
jgi:membrane-anchored protein YejM (alkaline phosphatase superfamily)